MKGNECELFLHFSMRVFAFTISTVAAIWSLISQNRYVIATFPQYKSFFSLAFLLELGSHILIFLGDQCYKICLMSSFAFTNCTFFFFSFRFNFFDFQVQFLLRLISWFWIPCHLIVSEMILALWSFNAVCHNNLSFSFSELNFLEL